MTTQVAGPAAAPIDDRYDEFLDAVRARFQSQLAERTEVFTVATEGLFEVFLGALPPELAAEHACGTCRAFVRRYGGMVRIAAGGDSESALWAISGVPPEFSKAVAAMREWVERAPITSLFRSEGRQWGRAERGGWTHLALTPPEHAVHGPTPLQTTRQYIAAKNADAETLRRALGEFPEPVVKQAVALLRTEQLYRSDTILGVATWLLELHRTLDGVRGRDTVAQARRDNLIRLAAATAPAGYAHVKSGMIGTLLTDLAEGLPFDSVRRRFAEKMDPLRYRRPTAAPTAAMIARAEQVIGELRAAGSLDRRFAKLADVRPIWHAPQHNALFAAILAAGAPAAGAAASADAPGRVPEPGIASADAPESRSGGVFAHLVPAGKRGGAVDLDTDPVVMTWEKFARTVLPTAQRVEYQVREAATSYGAMVTAANPEAPPIIQWDRADRRNPVTWYVYVKGSVPARWGLRPGEFREVTAVVPHPANWYGPDRTGREQAVLFALAGATDTGYSGGAGFFPEYLRAELHEIRTTLEAHTTGAVVAGRDAAQVCGLILSKGDSRGHDFRVTADGIRTRYTIDRWD
ncbi:hypothetical protein ACFVUS_08970 [Nocardia sp. NPDC058058]|uniref:hypothetical protein n=1 Tax=Nocardia sp. NPDC058058 TaxID=3346317 RepID=UPI0036DB8734